MDVWVAWLQEAGRAAWAWPALSFLVLCVLVTLWHIGRTVAWQRRMLRVRMHRPAALVSWRLLGGLAAGAAVSAAGLGLGFALDARALALFWILLALLAVFRLRLARAGMAAGLLALGQLALSSLGVPRPDDEASFAWLAWMVDAWTGLDAMGLLLLAGLLHLAEGLLLLVEKARFANPLVMAGKRGKRIGAWEVAAVWPVPLLLLVPGDLSLPWIPVLSDSAAGGWGLLLFPVPVGSGARTVAFWPEAKARFTARLSLLYGVIVAVLAAAAGLWREVLPALPWVAALAAVVFHELAALWNRWREQGRRLLYAHDGRGLAVLAVQPGTAAAEMGLRCGEIIRRVNGVSVSDRAQFHAALQRQPAYTRLEVLDRSGEVRYTQRARYAGEPHTLGVVPAPDGGEPAAFPARPLMLWHWLTGQGLLEAKPRVAGTGETGTDAAGAQGAEGAAGPEKAGSATAEAAADTANPDAAGAVAEAANPPETKKPSRKRGKQYPAPTDPAPS